MTSEKLQIDAAWLEAVLNKQLYDKSISKIVKVHSVGYARKGENNASEVLRVKVELIQGCGNKIKKSFILKRLPQCEANVQIVQHFAVFKKETKIYREVLPHFETIMNEYEDPNDKLWCKFISHKPYTEILLEDLKRQDFKVSNKKFGLSVKHGLLVMNSLGRLHGISHFLIKRGIINKDDLGKYYIETGGIMAERLVQGGLKRLAEVMETCWPPEWSEASGRLVKLADVARDRIVQLLSRPADDAFTVLCHGDCWTCNLMFKYSPYEENTPIALRFVDFQGCYYNVFTIDILNFLFTSMAGEVRRQNKDLLLKEYHKSLTATLNFYGIPEVAPSIEHVHAEIKRTKFMSVFYGLIFYAWTISDTENPVDLFKLASDCDAKEVYNPEIFKAENYRLAVGPDIKQWMEDGII